MNISPATEAMILEEMEKPDADIHRVSRQFGIPVRIIRTLTGEPRTPAVFQEKYGGMGRPELRPFFVSRTKAGQAWPEADRAVLDAVRAQYDEGLVEMCQGRDGDWIIQYAIPRMKLARHRIPYFSREFGDE